MFRDHPRTTIRSVHAFAIAIAIAAPAAAPSAEEAWTVGTLVCPLPLGAGPAFPALNDIQCHFRPLSGPAEAYSASVARMEAAESETGRATLGWYVMSREPDIARGALSGRYRLAEARPALSLAAAPSAMTGAGGVSLRPILVQGVRRLNLAAGVRELTLDFGV